MRMKCRYALVLFILLPSNTAGPDSGSVSSASVFISAFPTADFLAAAVGSGELLALAKPRP